MSNSISILIYFVLIQFVNDVCESLVCIKHIRFIKQMAFALFIISILFELNFIFFGYVIWVKRYEILYDISCYYLQFFFFLKKKINMYIYIYIFFQGMEM